MTNSLVDLSYLPDDLLLICLARVSRLYYPILSLVSKRFRSLLASLELYNIRKLLGCTENCLYVSLRFSCGSNPRWFTLCRRPTPNSKPNPRGNPNSQWFTSCFRPYKILKYRTRKEENKSSGKFMVSVPTCNDCPQFGLASILGITIGSNIYMIGGQINGAISSSRVFILDCRSHTWHEAPSMLMSRNCPLVSVLDGKIYVVDHGNVSDPSKLIEFFDPKTQIWEHIPIPIELLRGSFITRSLVFDEKLYVFGYNKSVVYKPKEQVWDVVGLGMRLSWVPNASSCVIDNVVYCFCVVYRKILCYNSEGRSWSVLKGLEKLPELPGDIRLVDCGGKIAVLWEKQVRAIGGSDKKMIWCAEIALERHNAQEIYGKIEWCNVVLTVPKSCTLLQFNAVTL